VSQDLQRLVVVEPEFVRGKPSASQLRPNVQCCTLAVAMIGNESEQEWADRVRGPAATIAIVLLIGILCYMVLPPFIFGLHPTLHATARF